MSGSSDSEGLGKPGEEFRCCSSNERPQAEGAGLHPNPLFPGVSVAVCNGFTRARSLSPVGLLRTAAVTRHESPFIMLVASPVWLPRTERGLRSARHAPELLRRFA
jgi:hypothetical protein